MKCLFAPFWVDFLESAILYKLWHQACAFWKKVWGGGRGNPSTFERGGGGHVPLPPTYLLTPKNALAIDMHNTSISSFIYMRRMKWPMVVNWNKGCILHVYILLYRNHTQSQLDVGVSNHHGRRRWEGAERGIYLSETYYLLIPF